jgi:hypothetical protein
MGPFFEEDDELFDTGEFTDPALGEDFEDDEEDFDEFDEDDIDDEEFEF